MSVPVTITYLEMRSRDALRPKPATDPRFTVAEATIKHWKLNRFLYAYVGERWAWRDKLAWCDEQWRAYAEREALRTFVAHYGGTPAGYFELQSVDDEVELIYFGLEERFIGHGLGGPLLTRAAEEAWSMNPRRVWVHTCTLDHPSALQNYLARGFVVTHTETRPAAPSAPSAADAVA